ncbi:hypothetical protein [Aquamicrobium sp. LC103]|uniref:hypothetical protein n=1 Tax=Aquamicrobium sp. LC103 TaxID=1120658 RepID=UPI00069A06F4|nr:hypothetical protein [Aquamicrobium sp. LC103]TKT74908.1 hypothetical protein XW59_020740 [Aquamicrobium sp. LC103]
MHGIRGIIADRFVAGLMAAALAYFLLLQGLFGAYAQTAMAVAEGGPGFVICSSFGVSDQGTDQPAKKLAHDCCSTACQAACSSLPAVSTTAVPVEFDTTLAPEQWHASLAARGPPPVVGLIPNPRAPPQVSI